MKIEDALQSKKSELEEIQHDIDSLEDQASVLKDQVKKYNDLKSQSADLKKIKKIKQKDLDTVIGFFHNVDDSYINKIFPLFANQSEDLEGSKAIDGERVAL